MMNFRVMADVSNNNTKGNVREYANAGHTILACKASEGNGFIDDTHAHYSREAHGNGLAVLHYHFARSTSGDSPFTEADLFSRVVKPTLAPGDYLCLDMERGKREVSLSDAAWCARFAERVKHSTGHTPIIYASESVFNSQLLKVSVPGQRFWVAKYGPPPVVLRGHRKAWAWQFTDGSLGPWPHEVAGFGQCDLSQLSLPIAVALRLRAARRRRVLSSKVR